MSITLTCFSRSLSDLSNRSEPIYEIFGLAQLLANNLEAARQQAGLIVSHDTDQLDHALTRIRHILSSLTEHVS